MESDPLQQQTVGEFILENEGNLGIAVEVARAFPAIQRQIVQRAMDALEKQLRSRPGEKWDVWNDSRQGSIEEHCLGWFCREAWGEVYIVLEIRRQEENTFVGSGVTGNVRKWLFVREVRDSSARCRIMPGPAFRTLTVRRSSGRSCFQTIQPNEKLRLRHTLVPMSSEANKPLLCSTIKFRVASSHATSANPRGEWHTTEFATSKDVDLSIYLLKETGEIPFDATLLFPVQQSRCCELVWKSLSDRFIPTAYKPDLQARSIRRKFSPVSYQGYLYPVEQYSFIWLLAQCNPWQEPRYRSIPCLLLRCGVRASLWPVYRLKDWVQSAQRDQENQLPPPRFSTPLLPRSWSPDRLP